MKRLFGRIIAGVPRSFATACFFIATSHTFAATEAEEREQRDFAATLAEWNFVLDAAEGELARESTSDSLLESTRAETESGVERPALRVVSQAEATAEQIRRLLDALGTPPNLESPDALPEDAAVSQQRRELSRAHAVYDGRAKQANLAATRARLLNEKISTRLRADFAQDLFLRSRSPLSGQVLSGAMAQAKAVRQHIADLPFESLAPSLLTARGRIEVATTIVILLISVALGRVLRGYLLHRFGRVRDIAQPSFARRVQAAIVVGVARGLVPSLLAVVVLLYVTTRSGEAGVGRDLAIGALAAFIFAVMISALARATLAPHHRAWRLTPLTDYGAKRIHRRLRILTVFVAIVFFLEFPAMGRLHEYSALEAVWDLIINSVIAALILSLLPARLWRIDETHLRTPRPSESTGPRRSLWPLFRYLVAISVLAIPLAAVLGYHNLSDYLARGLVLSGLFVGVLVVLHGMSRDLVTLSLASDYDGSDAARTTSGTIDQGNRLLRFWIIAGVDLVLFLFGAITLLLLWQVDWVDLQSWTRSALTGMKIGSMTISLTDILLALGVFVVVLLLTRWVQRFLEDQIFPQTRLDLGIRHSLKTAAGYVGLIIAATIAISMMGLDLSNLAIIFGALSVGIGFGLQNIVNNFVSGLILLIERPVKVGDWVVIGQNQGYVKRINVRATEIQTFQRSSIIIPNSELLSSAVINWTHKDNLARVDVPVNVAYGSDTQKVRELLLQCAKNHPQINAWPEPFVLFEDFGEGALAFELRFFIGQADQFPRISSDVRFAIDDAFRQEGIEIPLPRRDIRIRDLENLPQLSSRGETSDQSIDLHEARSERPESRIKPVS